MIYIMDRYCLIPNSQLPLSKITIIYITTCTRRKKIKKAAKMIIACAQVFSLADI
jgi:hypothetical protein